MTTPSDLHKPAPSPEPPKIAKYYKTPEKNGVGAGPGLQREGFGIGYSHNSIPLALDVRTPSRTTLRVCDFHPTGPLPRMLIVENYAKVVHR